MTIRESLLFTFNNENCRDYGVMNVSLDSGMQEEPFTPARVLLEQKIKGNSKPYFMGIEYEPLTISLRLAFEENFDSTKLRSLANWLTTDNYAPLIFESKQSHIYYAMLVDEGTLTHNAANQGYVSITLRCDSPWAWTPAYSQYHDFSENSPTGTSCLIHNVGDLPAAPLFEVEVLSGGSFSIMNTSNGGEKLEYTGLADHEKLTIDCLNKTVDSDIPLTYRYSNKTEDSHFITLVTGANYLIVQGNVKITIKYRGQLKG
ncbi:distal tail protein Dit [Paenibacillus sp. HB172176]|uniref:distal tail protein Dit n=1 Tax=Paenibacillus sp. HB172176 TaxID=2493690 RepID=UPI00143A3B3C|nr:distal tail protein Dit [Paenibacillus sp. HB172176]